MFHIFSTLCSYGGRVMEAGSHLGFDLEYSVERHN